ncbi:MAG: hypothetical protein ACXADB_05845 [Candidatus Hermodarchaeia archaeon]|jgi:hypothetical protein
MTIVANQDHQSDLMSWTVSVPKILRRLSRRRAIQSQIKFTVHNKSDLSIRTRIEVRSQSRVLIFRSTIKRKVGRDRIKETTETLHEVIEKELKPQSEKIFLFPIHYRPQITPLRPITLSLVYLIIGYDHEDHEVLNSGPHNLMISIE